MSEIPPYADWLGRTTQLDDVITAAPAKAMSATLGTRDEPAKAGCSIADIAAGMYAYSNILAALLGRGQTGQGRHIDVSMLESMVEWMGYPLYYSCEGAAPPPRAGAAHATIHPYGPFPTGDAKTVMLGLQNEREWEQFCERVLQRPELVRDPRFVSNSARTNDRQALRAIIVEVFSQLSAEQVIERLEVAQIANARMNDMHAVWQHEQLKARQRWSEVDTPAGMLPALLPPGTADAASARMDPVPALGQHTDAILRELGYTSEQIAAMRGANAI